MVRPKVSSMGLQLLKISKTGDSTSLGYPGAAGCHHPSPRCPCSHDQPFWELPGLFPSKLYTVVKFRPPTSSRGCYPGTGRCDRAGLLHPSLEPGGHPQTQLDFSKSKYFAPSPGSKWRGLETPILPPSFCLERDEDTRLGLSHWPPLLQFPSILPFPCRTPKTHLRLFWCG